MAGFDALLDDAPAFLAGVRDNNTRDWWAQNKATYDANLKAPALALMEALTGPLKALTGHDATPKLFRPHRDVRFSKDKTPYNSHLHMMWSLAAGGRQNPVVFFGIDPDKVTVGGGVMGFDKEVLTDWRKMIDLDGPRIGNVIADAEAKDWALWEPSLKRVPSPFPQDHPQGDLLRRKGLVLSKPLGGKGALDARILADVETLVPTLRMLDAVL